METKLTSSNAPADRKQAALSPAPRIQGKLSVKSNVFHRTLEPAFAATVELTNLEATPVTIYKGLDGELFRLSLALRAYRNPFVFRRVATGKVVAGGILQEDCYFKTQVSATSGFETIPAHRSWHYDAQINMSDILAMKRSKWNSIFNEMEARQKHRMGIKEGVEIKGWSYGPSEAFFEQACKDLDIRCTSYPEPAVLEVVQIENAILTIAAQVYA